MKKFTILTFTILCATATHTFAQGPSGGGSSSSSVAYSSGATLTFKSNATYTDQTYSQANSGYNVVKETCATATLTNCTLTKTGATASSGDNSSFYGINAAVYVSKAGVLTM